MILPDDIPQFDSSRRQIWFASATAALIAALEAVKVKGRWVAVAPNVCPNVIVAIYSAGAQPWFVDIESARQGMCPQALAEVINDVAAVIAVHAYGVPCLIGEIAELTRRSKAVLIEDCAQAEGAGYLGTPVGQFGDVSVFSFGVGKILDAGGGGLALADGELAERIEMVSMDWITETASHVGDDLGQFYKFLYNRFYPEKLELIQNSFLPFIDKLSPGFRRLCDPSRISQIKTLRMDVPELVAERNRKYLLYLENIETKEIVKPVPIQNESASWRCNILIDPSLRDGLFKLMLSKNFKVSTWYPRISKFLPANAYSEHGSDVAEQFEKSILNLWLDETTSDDEIINCCNFINSTLKNNGKIKHV